MVRFLWRLSARSIFLASVLGCNGGIAEGFVADTLVRTSSGYAHIQDLCVGDELLAYTFEDTCASSRIIQIAHHQVETTIRIDIGDGAIETAEDQLLFIPLQRTWLPASQLQEGMYLLESPLNAVRVQSVERVEQSRDVYTVSLDKYHTYLISDQDVVVHNAALATIGTISLGSISVCNPVTVLLGATVALFTIGYRAWHKYATECDTGKDCCDSQIPGTILLAERSYYEQRKKELEDLKSELMSLKNYLTSGDVTTLVGPKSFTYQFLQSVVQTDTSTQLSSLSIAEELQLSQEEKNALMNARQEELDHLEREIWDAQLVIASHANGLLEQLQRIRNDYEAISVPTKKTAHTLQGITRVVNPSNPVTLEDTVRWYEIILRQEYLLLS